MHWKNLTLTLVVVPALLGLAGCSASNDSSEEAAAEESTEQIEPAEPEAQAVGGAGESYHYVSAEGNFQVTWPSGCDELRIRANEPEYFEGEDTSDVILVHAVACDRAGETGEGCSVTATFDAKNRDGGEAGIDQVLSRVRNTLKYYGVKVTRQVPVRREFADGLSVEGIDVYGEGPDGKGQFWVRGMLAYHDVYLLTAWSVKGDLWENPSYLEFFNGFLPYAE